MRITIGNKVFGIAASMTVIVAVTAIISSYFVSSVNDEVERVAEIYIPLSNTIAEIEIHNLEEELLFERVLRGFRDGHADSRIDATLAKIEQRKKSVREEIEEGLRLLALAQREEHFVDFKVEVARLTALLEQISRQQQDLDDQETSILSILDKDKDTDIQAASVARSKLDQGLEVQIAAVAKEINVLTVRAARSASQSEIWALRANIIATAAAALFGLIMAGLVARGLVRPIHKLVDAAGELERGNLSPSLQVYANDEIGNLTHAFQAMTAELRIKAQITDTFGKYVDPRVVESLTNGEHAGLGDGERQVYSVFFSDIAGFTGISEKLTPKALVNLINAYLSEMSGPIEDGQGVIDKYIGDAIMAYWGPPFTPDNEHAPAACRAALEQQRRIVDFRQRIGEITGLRRDVPDISMRIGIATGDVLVGSVGSERTRNYTVIGDTVNLAARLEGLGKRYGTQILVCEQTKQAAGAEFEFRELDIIAVAGKTEAVRLFELLGEKGALTSAQMERRDGYEAALKFYQDGDWSTARAGLVECLNLDETDHAAHNLLERLDDFEGRPPENWDGVWRFSEK
jgi:adenylate cyclase